MYADTDIRIGGKGRVSQMQTKADKGGRGAKNYQIFADVLYGRPPSTHLPIPLLSLASALDHYEVSAPRSRAGPQPAVANERTNDTVLTNLSW